MPRPPRCPPWGPFGYSLPQYHAMNPSDPPHLLIEQPPHDAAEAACLAQLTNLVATTDPRPDLRDLAPAVRQLFPEPAYRVGCGGAHIWLARANDPQRLVLIC